MSNATMTSTAAVTAHALRAPAPLRWALGASQAVSPHFAAWLGERLFFTPPRHPLPAGADRLLSSGRRFSTLVDGRVITGWHWGRGPTVYLVHGWGGRGGRLAGYVAPLVAEGHAVVAFDAPGHGEGRPAMSSMPEFARALHSIVELCGPAHAVVGHSLGAAAAAMAVGQGLRPARLVLLAPPADPASFLAPFARALGLSADVTARLRARSEARLHIDWAELDVLRMAPATRVPLLVVHDQGDRTVPFSNGAAIAERWGGSLLETAGLDHAGLLRDPVVIRTVTGFVAGTADPAAPLPLSEASGLEWSLFNREARW